MDKLLPVVFSALLGLAGLTGVCQAQQDHSGQEPSVDGSGNAGDPEDVQQNVDDMLRLLSDLQNDQEPEKGLKAGSQKHDDMGAASHPGHVVPPNGNHRSSPAHIERKSPKNHIEPANEVVKFVPDDPASHFRLGMNYWRSNKLDIAILHFGEVVRLDPGNAHAYWNLGLLYERKNMGAEALDSTRKAEAIYAKYDYSLYVAQARKRIQKLASKFHIQ